MVLTSFHNQKIESESNNGIQLIVPRNIQIPQSPKIIRNNSLQLARHIEEENKFESFISISWEPLHKDLYESIFKLILDNGLFFNNAEERKKSPYKFKSPEELQILIDFKLGMEGSDHKTLYDILGKIIRYSPHHSHPFYLDKFSAGLDPLAIAGDFLATTLSSPAIIYLSGPVFTLMEEEVKKKIRELVGYEGGKGDGIIIPGAGISSVMALRLALHKKYPNTKQKGHFTIDNPKICFFISEHATKAFNNAAFINGIGENGCIYVKTDLNGRMCITSLKNEFGKAISNGFNPLLVVATAGTATLGAIDPINDIAEFCEQQELWLHVDADYAGSYFLSDKHKYRLQGIHRSDSINWSPTGMLGASYCKNFLLTRHEKLFLATYGMHAQYVFAKTDLYDPIWDNGDRTLQTTRRVDILRLWLMWKAKGKNGLAQHVEYIHTLSKFFLKELRRRENIFELILDNYDSTKISFYYIPKCLRESERKDDYSATIMKTFTKLLKSELLLSGAMQLGISSLPLYPDFFTISVTNSALKYNDIVYILDKIEYCADRLEHLKKSTIKFTILNGFTGSIPIQVPNHITEYPEYVSAPINILHKTFFQKLFRLISDKALYFQDKRHESPCNFRPPEILLKEFDFELRDEPGVKNEDELIKIMEKIIFYSNRQAHPYFVVQLLSAGMDPYSIMAEFILSTHPAAMLTYEQAPVYALMEKEVFKMVRERIGYKNGEGDGMLCAGGSLGVIAAINIAIISKFPETKKNGITGSTAKKLVFYLSENGHICFKKAGLLLGMGTDNCVYIKSDQKGKMIISELEKSIQKTIQEGGTPFFVGATSGTTVLGVFDPLEEIADICERYNLWLHSDASLGGSVMMSDTKKDLYLKGVERSDSMNFNAHKFFGIPLESSILVCKQRGILKRTFKTEDPINFPFALHYSSSKHDMIGGGGIQTDRRANIAKFWFLWKAKGIIGMGKHVDYAYSMKDYTVSQIKQRGEGFQIWQNDFDFPAVCFLYIPLCLRKLERNSDEFKTRINEVANLLRNELILKTSVMIGTLSDRDSPILLKMVLMSSGLVKSDVDHILNQIDLYGKYLHV